MSVDCTECGAKLPSHGSLDLHRFSHATGVTAGDLSGVPTPMALSEALTPQARNRQAVLGQATAVAIMAMVVFLAGIGSLFVVEDKPSTVPVAAGAPAGGADPDPASDGATTTTPTGGTEPSAAAAATPEVAPIPADYRLVSRPGDGFAIAIPTRFEELSLSTSQLSGMADALRSTNPEAANLLSQNRALVDQARLFAIDKSSGDNQIVQRIAIPAAASIDELPAGLFSETYREIGAADVVEQRVHINAGDALKVVVTMPIGEVTIQLTQHVVVRASSVWVLTYTEVASARTGTATTIANSFRFAD